MLPAGIAIILPGSEMPGSFSVQGCFSRYANSIVRISFCYSLSGPSSFFTGISWKARPTLCLGDTPQRLGDQVFIWLL